ncbi:hypothetical protein OOK48_35340 [Streptomyces viridodiastaticus]|uniref:hypothetical protein n=1 Tax=Streptomyces albogriseolus TaxID=1887 RepID=UPI00225A371C|nr:hypothetical protein [Streptomyces viridodiastaticus]MCX4571597.1 hypothetical protein [Streptomyces viridodiastaticus]
MTDTPDFNVPGPALFYLSTQDESGLQSVHRVDLTAVQEDRERALCRALLQHAMALMDEAEDPAGLLALARSAVAPVDGA